VKQVKHSFFEDYLLVVDTAFLVAQSSLSVPVAVNFGPFDGTIHFCQEL
jgi:hypothetical protein